jgi:hypothetical protein
LEAGRSALTIETGEIGATEVTGIIVTIAVIVDVVAELAHRGATDTTRVHRPLLCAPITVVVYAIADLGEGLGRSITRELTSVTHGHTRATRAHIVATRLTYACYVLVDEAIAVFVEVIAELGQRGATLVTSVACALIHHAITVVVTLVTLLLLRCAVAAWAVEALINATITVVVITIAHLKG